mmetsp:Transcript_106213/g.305392  ORF Transcript_106213/g.305392 Transcript_106213/m.305392 type:complete len:357 (-) Transcript_106213:529-1599(-)
MRRARGARATRGGGRAPCGGGGPRKAVKELQNFALAPSAPAGRRAGRSLRDPSHRAERRRRGGVGLAPTGEPRARVLERVVGDLMGVPAARGMATRIAQEVHAVDDADMEQLQALLHVEVLAPALPIEALLALVLVGAVHADGVAREDLQRAEELEGPRLVVPAPVAVGDEERRAVGVPGLVVGVQADLQAVGEEHGVRIDLDDPLVVPPTAVFEDHVPSLEEDERVQPRARRRARLRQVAHADVALNVDLRHRHAAHVDHATVAEDHVLVAGEDPDPFVVHGVDQPVLVALRPDDSEAHHPREHGGRGGDRRRRRRDGGGLRCARRRARRRARGGRGGRGGPGGRCGRGGRRDHV